jgi:hypothetical protein
METEPRNKNMQKSLSTINEIINDLEHIHNNIINNIKLKGEVNGAEYYYYYKFDRMVQKWIYKFKWDKRILSHAQEKEHRKLVRV